MKKTVLLLSVLLAGYAVASDFEYVGSKKCKSCHKSEKKGAQYPKWEESKHGNAFETLKSEQALEIAKSKGLKTAPHEAPECLKCHTVGYGEGGYEVKDEAFWNPADDDKEGKKAAKRMEGLKNVGCESCHGPGSEYKKKKVMKAIYEGTEKAEDHGLVIPDEKTCLSCHNEESPTYKEFNYKERLEKIAHPIPEDMDKE